MFDLDNLGQGHGVKHSQWSHSNINVDKSRKCALFASSRRFVDVSI